jgi:hypothetical protein
MTWLGSAGKSLDRQLTREELRKIVSQYELRTVEVSPRGRPQKTEPPAADPR